MKTTLLTIALLFASIASFGQANNLTINNKKYNFTITLPVPSTSEYSVDEDGTIAVSTPYGRLYLYPTTELNGKTVTPDNYKELFKSYYNTQSAQTLKNGIYVVDYYENGGDYQYYTFIYMVSDNLFIRNDNMDKTDEVLAMLKKIVVTKN